MAADTHQIATLFVFFSMLRALKRLLAFLGFWSGHQSPGAERDPYAWRPVPCKPQPKGRSGAVAVAEPDE